MTVLCRRRANRRPLWLILVVLIALVTDGCWDRREIEDVALIAAVGIDKIEDGYEVTVELARPPAMARTSEAGSHGPQSMPRVLSGRGRTVFGAIRHISPEAGRQLFWSHARVVLIGESLARAPMDQVMDFIDREREFRRSFWVLVVRGEAAQLLRQEERANRSLAAEVIGMLENRARNAMAPRTILNTFLRALESDAEDAICGVVGAAPQVNTGGLPLPAGSEGTTGVAVAGAAIFRQGRLVGWLDREAAAGVMWAMGQADRGFLEMVDSATGEALAVEIVDQRTRITPYLRSGRIGYTVKIMAKAFLAEARTPGRPLGQGDLSRFERSLVPVIQRKVRAAVMRSRETNSDFLRLGETLNRSMPKVWKRVAGRWRELLAEVQVDVQVDMRITGTGVRIDANPSR